MSVPAEKLEPLVSIVPLKLVPSYWNIVEPLLEPAIKRTSGRYTTSQVRQQLLRGEQQLWVAHDGNGSLIAAATTMIVNYPNKRMFVIHLLGGRDREIWMDEGLVKFCQYAKDTGCFGVETIGRKGLAKIFEKIGGRQAYSVFEYMFED